MKKKLLFVCYGLGIGGIETCLVNLLNALPEKKFQIDVLLMNPEYELKPRIRTSVHYLDSFQYVMNTTDTMNQIKEHGGIIKNLRKFISYCNFRIRVKIGANSWKAFRSLPSHYDIAIAYSQNDYSPYYVIDKVNADRKVMWYHNGMYERYGKKYRRDEKYFSKFDYIVAVSSDCKQMLETKFGILKEKIIVLHNICDVAYIQEKADSFIPSSFDNQYVHLVTVGRMTKEKGADLAVEVCRHLCEKGLAVKWHWVGDGNQKEEIQKKVEEYKLQDHFVFEGNQENPYPYIKCADVYVQPSYYEAYSTTVTEAKVLHKPIVVTDVGGMREQLKNINACYIVNADIDSLLKAILCSIKTKEFNILSNKGYKDLNIYSETVLTKYFKTVFSDLQIG